MCCDPREMRRAHHVSCCEPGCCTSHAFARHFVSSKEEMERLRSYKDDLEKEIAGVEERIQEIKGGK